MKIVSYVGVFLLGMAIMFGFSEMQEEPEQKLGEDYEMKDLPEEVQMELEFYRHNHDRIAESCEESE